MRRLRTPTPARCTGRLDETALQRADRRLLREVDGAFEWARRKAGGWLVCRPGCSECCHGPFPVNRLDVRRLLRGLRRLEARDPARAAAIRRRAGRARTRLREGFPGDPATGILSGDEEAEERFSLRHASVPCPVLDPGSGTCDLYGARPVACRTFGPPVRFGSARLPPCRLCFQGAPAREMERCRVAPDPEGIEDVILDGMEAGGGEPPETFIAFALAGSVHRRAPGRPGSDLDFTPGRGNVCS